ncbi:hypothetical protein [Streptomyces sp. NPDC059063]
MKIYADDVAASELGGPDGEYGPWWHAEWIPFVSNCQPTTP